MKVKVEKKARNRHVAEYIRELENGVFAGDPEAQFVRVDRLLDVEELDKADREWLRRHRLKLQKGERVRTVRGRPPSPEGIIRDVEKFARKVERHQPFATYVDRQLAKLDP